MATPEKKQHKFTIQIIHNFLSVLCCANSNMVMVSSRYFSTPYSLPKLDMVAVPEFSGGAMENYGLITYRENEMLYDHLHSTTARKQRVYFQLCYTFAVIQYST